MRFLGRLMARKTGPRRGNSHYRNVPIQNVINYSTTLLDQIRQRFAGVESFTRDDLLHLPIMAFEQVGTISRYRATCIAVAYLVEHGQLIQKKAPDLCLPERAASYRFEETTISSEYATTIRRLVSTMPAQKPFAVMTVVQRWRTDPQLTRDSKRKAVRNAIRGLVREGVCDRSGGFEYVVGAKS